MFLFFFLNCGGEISYNMQGCNHNLTINSFIPQKEINDQIYDAK